MARFLFLAIASLGLLAALGTVLARNLVRAALHLVAFFFCVACLFVVLEAEFLAAVQVLIYIGAVAILLMFGIMLTRNAATAEADLSGGWRAPGLVAGLCVFTVLVFGINNAVSPSGSGAWSAIVSRPTLDPAQGVAWKAERSRAVDDMPRVVGEQFMTRYALAFELAGLLLTAALVGAVALAREEPTSGDAGETTPVEAETPVGSTP